jgi:hypothetical protein
MATSLTPTNAANLARDHPGSFRAASACSLVIGLIISSAIKGPWASFLGSPTPIRKRIRPSP